MFCFPADSEAQRRMQFPLALPEELRQIEAASFIIREETRDLVTNKNVKKNIGSGFFNTPRFAHTCIHNLEIQDEKGVAAKPVTEGHPVSCVMLKGEPYQIAFPLRPGHLPLTAYCLI